MPHVFTHVEIQIWCVCCFSCERGTATFQEYNRRIANRRIPDKQELCNVFITLRQRGTHLSPDVSFELEHLQNEQKLISFFIWWSVVLPVGLSHE